jgi:tryptophan-rich sensory protein
VSLAARLAGRPLPVAAAAAILVALLGMAATDLGPWYQNLQRPPWQPPDWVFGPAWTTIFALMVVSAVTAWKAAATRALRQRIILAFGINALLNILWSSLFFAVRRPDWALIEVCFLWLSVAVLMAVLAPISRRAAWLQLPYLAWITFAGILNLAVVRLNQPF